MSRNALLPFIRSVRDEVAKTGPVTVKRIREHVRRDVDTYEQVLAAQNPKHATRVHLNSTIRTALDAWPAYRADDGTLVHVDPDVENPSWVWERIRALRVEQSEHLADSIADATNRRDDALLREQLEQGVP